MSKVTVSEFVVRNGASVDLEKTLDKFSAALQEFLAQEELVSGKVGEAVHAVLDKYPGCKFNQASITSYTLRELGCEPSEYQSMTEAIASYIKANTGTRESGAMFKVSRGKGVNFARWSDLPADEK